MAKAARPLEQILFYGQKGPYAFLSNFYPSAIVVDFKTWTTVEHRYQAMKTADVGAQEDIRLGYPLGTHPVGRPDSGETVEVNLKPGEAKKKGQKVKKRNDWSTVKELFMYEALRAKFMDPDLRNKLLGTGKAELIENSPTDEYWGCGADGRGQNRLGVLLMQLRSEIRSMTPCDTEGYVPPKRVITVVLEVWDDSRAKELYEYFREQRELKGCLVNTIADGDLIKKYDDLRNSL